VGRGVAVAEPVPVGVRVAEPVGAALTLPLLLPPLAVREGLAPTERLAVGEEGWEALRLGEGEAVLQPLPVLV
jgi:hypothetical protein